MLWGSSKQVSLTPRQTIERRVLFHFYCPRLPSVEISAFSFVILCSIDSPGFYKSSSPKLSHYIIHKDSVNNSVESGLPFCVPERVGS